MAKKLPIAEVRRALSIALQDNDRDMKEAGRCYHYDEEIFCQGFSSGVEFALMLLGVSSDEARNTKFG